MNVISIDGVEYVKAGIIAKQYKYTSDYVGQLCRSRKVDAKLVGRTWYVNPLSLTSHKTARYTKDTSAEKVIQNNDENKFSRLDVEPLAKRPVIKAAVRSLPPSANFLKRVEWKPLKYELDESELNPSLRSMQNPVNVPVDLAESKNLKISSDKEESILGADPLPQVTLRGTLNLSSLDVDFDLSEENIASSDVITEEELVERPVVEKPNKIFLHKNHHHQPKDVSRVTQFAEAEEISESQATYAVEINEVGDVKPLTFTPSRVRERTYLQKESLDDDADVSTSTLWLWMTLFTLGLLTSLSVFFVEFTITASVQNFAATWQISTDFDLPFSF